MIERELSEGTRIVAETPALVAISPFAARMPYETWILPRQHSSHFEDLSDSGVNDLAGLLGPVVAAIEDACSGGAYNYVIHSAPFDTPAGDHYHWHVEIIPRMTRLAGFEWGTGWHINPVTPEAAAQRLRKLLGRAEEKRSSAASLPIS
jgi:UDPglucose--hexose-1-phosphate uridylyltransferase